MAGLLFPAEVIEAWLFVQIRLLNYFFGARGSKYILIAYICIALYSFQGNFMSIILFHPSNHPVRYWYLSNFHKQEEWGSQSVYDSGVSIFENSPGNFSVQLSLRTSRSPVLSGGVLSLQFNSFRSYLQRDFYCNLKEKMTLLGPSFLQHRYQPFIRGKKELKKTL